MAVKKSKHIGIVACTYEGAALCYKTICHQGAQYLGEYAHPEISVHTYPLSDYMEYIDRNDWDGVAQLMAASAQKLIAIGAEILICPDNTIHQSYSRASENITQPWLHIAGEVVAEAQRSGFNNLALLGTRYLMEGPVYLEKCSQARITYQVPGEEDREEINRIIFEELVQGIINEDSKKYLFGVIEKLKSQGCDAVVLGCTELPLIIFPEDATLPVLDSTRILARAALREAML